MGQKVSLVLSSGGARGLAHIGVIEALEDHGFEIVSVAGASMGAIVGGAYAAGKFPEFKEWMLGLDKMEVFKLIDFTVSLKGFIRGDRVFREFSKILPDCAIEDLPVSFTALAADLQKQEEVVFDKGSLHKALRASIAIPTVLTPVFWDDKELVDGGILNPIPMTHVKRHYGDRLVVANVNAIMPYQRISIDEVASEPPSPSATAMMYNKLSLEDTRLNAFLQKWRKLLPSPGQKSPIQKLGFFEVVTRSIDLMQDRISSLQMELSKPDMLINFSRQACTTFEFYRAKEMIEEGRCVAEKAIEAYLEKKDQ
ncbi:patatin-like phospholipase family protein [Roseivirga sp. BDSF3-8]|uniref:patatin-like phospholipase family protein n=1 Tax=Roseivirga sp. BDSF3-8 TaxID=3241598 RepID=UPI003531C811